MKKRITVEVVARTAGVASALAALAAVVGAGNKWF
jgi:hypothetical protein